MTRSEFITTITKAAEKAAKYGAPINVQIVVAQAAIEAQYGRSRLFKNGKNLFGLRADDGWAGDTVSFRTREFIPGHGWKIVVERYRAYPTFFDCLRDYGALIEKAGECKNAAKSVKSPSSFLVSITNSQHRDDPSYASKIWTTAMYWGLIPRGTKMPAILSAYV